MDKETVAVDHHANRVQVLGEIVVVGEELGAKLDLLDSYWYPPESGALAEGFGALSWVLRETLRLAKERLAAERAQLPKIASSISSSLNDR